MSQWNAAVRSVRGLQAVFACVFAALALGGPAAADEFEAFCWARHHPASTEHVTPLVHVDPSSDMADIAARLKALPSGKRFIIFHWITDDLADNPADRVLQRTWELRPSKVAAPAPTASSRAQASRRSVSSAAAPVMASSGRSSATAAAGKSTSVNRNEATVMVRVAVDRPTQFRGPWMDAGIATVRARVQSVMARLKALDAPLDGVAIDNETTLHAANFVGVPGSLEAVQADPRWPALAKAMGLPVELSGMWWGTPLYHLWTERMAARFDAAMNAAAYQPIRRAYPRAIVSNYCSGRMLAVHATPDVNGHLDRSATAGFGTHDNSEFYGWLAAGRIERARGSVPTSDGWLAFRVEMHKIRGMNASSARPKHAWVASRSWAGETWGRVPFAGTPLWDELVLQLGMNGVRQFFELSIEDFSISRERNLERRWADRLALDAALAELNARVSGASPTVLAARQPSWNDQVVATGRQVGDRVVWRFSFADGIDAVRVRLSDGSEHEIAVEPGRRGAWFDHPSDVAMLMDSSNRLPSVEVVATRAGSPSVE